MVPVVTLGMILLIAILRKLIIHSKSDRVITMVNGSGNDILLRMNIS